MHISLHRIFILFEKISLKLNLNKLIFFLFAVFVFWFLDLIFVLICVETNNIDGGYTACVINGICFFGFRKCFPHFADFDDANMVIERRMNDFQVQVWIVIKK